MPGAVIRTRSRRPGPSLRRVRTPPDDLAEAELVALLAEAWDLRGVELEHAPVGFGSHHWVATDPSGVRRFVTVDEVGEAASSALSRPCSRRGPCTTPPGSAGWSVRCPRRTVRCSSRSVRATRSPSIRTSMRGRSRTSPGPVIVSSSSTWWPSCTPRRRWYAGCLRPRTCRWPAGHTWNGRCSGCTSPGPEGRSASRPAPCSRHEPTTSGRCCTSTTGSPTSSAAAARSGWSRTARSSPTTCWSPRPGSCSSTGTPLCSPRRPGTCGRS